LLEPIGLPWDASERILAAPLSQSDLPARTRSTSPAAHGRFASHRSSPHLPRLHFVEVAELAPSPLTADGEGLSTPQSASPNAHP